MFTMQKYMFLHSSGHIICLIPPRAPLTTHFTLGMFCVSLQIYLTPLYLTSLSTVLNK